MNSHKLNSRLGLKFTAFAGVALLVALCVFIMLYEGVTWWVINGEAFEPFWEKECGKAVASFGEYVEKHALTVDMVMRDVKWEKRHKQVSMYLSPNAEETAEDTEGATTQGTRIVCADGAVYAYVSPSETYYDNIGLIVSIAASAFVFFSILLPYVYHIIGRIAHLSEEMEILTGGDLNYVIESRGRDELSELGRNIEAMRLSVLDRMARENVAVLNNSRLITSLSHDLRTPLTRLTGYLEILRLKMNGASDEQMRYIDASLENAQHMKELSDEMFRHFQVDTPNEDAADERVSGALLLSQLISEMCFDLEAMGFTATPPVIDSAFTIAAPTLDVKRIFDNLYSNLKKYADKDRPVRISVKKTGDSISISVQNGVAHDTHETGSGVGLPTIQSLARKSGGSVEVENDGNNFIVSIELPVDRQYK